MVVRGKERGREGGGGGWDEWGRGELRGARSENGKGKRAAGFRNRNSAQLLK